jgi:hypothetical protein
MPRVEGSLTSRLRANSNMPSTRGRQGQHLFGCDLTRQVVRQRTREIVRGQALPGRASPDQ